jgi:hypothetical protein
MQKPALFLLPFALCILVPRLSANWGSSANGSVATGNFRAQGTNQVEILREELSIKLYRDHAMVEVEYTMHNIGAAVQVRAGFPSLGLEPQPDEKLREIEDYSFTADGNPVAFSRERGNAKPFRYLYDKKFSQMAEFFAFDPGEEPMLLEWLVSTVPFAADQTRKIRIRYKSIYASCSGGYSDDFEDCDDRFAYVLSTGAAWKGPIQKGRVTIEAMVMDAGKLIITPSGHFQRDGNLFTWEFQNLKPTAADDILVNLNNGSIGIAVYLEHIREHCPPFEYYVYRKGRYFYLTQNFEASGAGTDADHGSEYLCEDGMYSSWVAPHAPGIGDVVTLRPLKPVHFDEIGIVPACVERKENPMAKARIKSVEVMVNGKSSRTATLADGDAPFDSGWDASHHWVRLPEYAGEAREIQVKILSVYPGSKSQSTCMSDLMLRQWLPSRPNVESGVDGHKLP